MRVYAKFHNPSEGTGRGDRFPDTAHYAGPLIHIDRRLGHALIWYGSRHGGSACPSEDARHILSRLQASCDAGLFAWYSCYRYTLRAHFAVTVTSRSQKVAGIARLRTEAVWTYRSVPWCLLLCQLRGFLLSIVGGMGIRSTDSPFKSTYLSPLHSARDISRKPEGRPSLRPPAGAHYDSVLATSFTKFKSGAHPWLL